MNNFNTVFNSQISETTALVFIFLLMVWSIIWKGIALWKSARLLHKKWFIALLIINSAGILEIIYIFLIAKKKKRK